jgi:uncharacterized Zn-binding protein involved in type VI secretion
MEIIGWIRYGDKAACGATVIEASSAEISYNKGYSFEGARMACRKNCIIIEGFPSAFLSNGRRQVIHGMLTSGGCPLQSTLNDIDGVGNEDGKEIFPAFVQDENGGWKGIYPPAQEHEQAYDEYFMIMDEKSCAPAKNRFYRITLDTGEVIEGHTDEEGLTQYATSDKRVALTLEIAPQQEIQVGD